MIFWCFELPLEFIQGILVSGRKVKKSREAHVSAHKNCKTHRKTMPLLSTHYPGPKEHVRYPFDIDMTSTSHSTGAQKHFLIFSKTNFFYIISKGFLHASRDANKKTHEKCEFLRGKQTIAKIICMRHRQAI